MEEVKYLNFVFFNKKTNCYYKRNQKETDYAYYDCFDSTCPGRIRVESNSTIIHVMKKHKKHTIDVENDVKLMQIKYLSIEMANDKDFAEFDPAKLYKEILKPFENVVLPIGHKSDTRKRISNARNRFKRNGNYLLR